MTTALLPCPFCGSEGRISWSGDQEVVNVRCANWNPGSCLGAGANCYEEPEAIAAWNRRFAQSERTSPFDRDYLAKIERDAATMKVLRMLLREAHDFLNAQCVVEEDYADWEKRYKAFTESLDRLAAGVAFVTDTRLGGD